MAKKSAAGDDFLSLLPWGLLGAAAGWGIYMLVKSAGSGRSTPASSTRPADVAPVASPSRFADLASVDTRLDQVKELFRMGYLTPSGAWLELDGLAAAAAELESRGVADPAAASGTIARIDAVKGEVERYMDLERQGVTGPTGQRMGGVWFSPRTFRGAN